MVSSLSSKKRTKTSRQVVKSNFLVEMSAWKNHFEFVWPFSPHLWYQLFNLICQQTWDDFCQSPNLFCILKVLQNTFQSNIEKHENKNISTFDTNFNIQCPVEMTRTIILNARLKFDSWTDSNMHGMSVFFVLEKDLLCSDYEIALKKEQTFCFEFWPLQ